ncbi:MAG: hypothetical protein V7731_13630 [Amphritea sp.]
MSESYKPLFNRTYLKVILWVVAIAIVLLSSSGSDRNDYITVQQIDQQPVYFVSLDKRDTLELQFIYRLGAALSSEKQLMHRLLEDLITEQLDSEASQQLLGSMQARTSVQLLDDRLTIYLSLPTKALSDHQQLTALPGRLTRLLDEADRNVDLEHRWNRLEAELYLQNKKPEANLLHHFGELIDSRSGVHPIQKFPSYFDSVINNRELTIALYGPQSKLIAQAVASQLPGYQTSIPLATPALTPARRTLPSMGNTPYVLTGTTLKGRQSDEFAKQLLAVRTLQALLKNQQQLKYRLIWKPLDNSGYLTMMLHGSRLPTDPEQLQGVYDDLQTGLDTALIDSTRDALQKQFKQRMEQQEAQLGMLNAIAFYQLPVDYMPRFSQTLDKVDNNDVLRLVKQYLNSKQSHFIYLPAL